jgi:DNA repair protein RadA/Sms
MAKARLIYSCRECNAESTKWLGKCNGCGAWNTLEEKIERDTSAPSKNRFDGLAPTHAIANLCDIEDAGVLRFSTGIPEFDRVVGGGFVQGSVVLIGAAPGLGKSTLLLQAAEFLSASMRVIYNSGEESGQQVKSRATRLGLGGKHIRFLGEVCLEKILTAIEVENPACIVIDSIQSVYSDALSSSPGSVGQIKECAGALTRVAKSRGVIVILVGHITKNDNELAGPRALEHLVDCVLIGEGDSGSQYRLLRATKNRYGSAAEIGIFSMQANGMRGVSNASAIFMSTHPHPVPGSCIVAALEGSRVFLVELQALVCEGGPSPRRLSVGLDRERLAMLLAVLARHAEISLGSMDCFINAVGGIRLEEPGTDLPTLLAIVSSLKGRSLPRGFSAFGEVGLVGEVRPVPRGQERLREAARLGMSYMLVPKGNMPKQKIEGLTVVGVERVEEALDIVRSLS